MQWQHVELLLIEDDDGDIRLMREALKTARHPIRLSVVSDGLGALAFLQREAAYTDAPRPHLILLDLHLPDMHGRDVLKAIKTDRALKEIPVIILSTSSNRGDIQSAYAQCANSYITKPGNFQEYRELIRSLAAFWLDTAQLPR